MPMTGGSADVVFVGVASAAGFAAYGVSTWLAGVPEAKYVLGAALKSVRRR
jgi:hypothetical protein